MSPLDEWLKHAPSPPALLNNQKWHVFLSYRSIHRPWVIQLYDVLQNLGYEVFLDQYVLSASDRLVSSLEEGLERSASGVLVWSSATSDSEWCKKEYEAMEMLSHHNKDFRYVVAVLDQVKLPLFAQKKLYIDFSKFRDGPTGTGLLKLLYGLLGKPLPDAGVRLATHVDEATHQDETKILAYLETGNAQKLLELAQSEELQWHTSALLGCAVAESLVKLKKNSEALDVLSKLEKEFDKAIRPKQLKGLALARSGDWQAAQEILGQLEKAGEQDPETLGIYARTWFDRYTQSENDLHLRKSRDLYMRAFDNAPNDYYTGINAASKSVFLGDLDQARQLADRTEHIVGTDKEEGNYWLTATVAEVQLIKQNYEKAAQLYSCAVAMKPEEIASHESTWGQAKRLMEKLHPAVDQRQLVAKAFQHLNGNEG